jgi:hypothetical protein
LTWLLPSKEFQAKLPPVFQPFRLHAPLESLQSSFNVLVYRLLLTVVGKKEDSACQLNPLRTLESKRLKLSVTAANKSLREFEAKSLSLDFMT